MSGVMQVLAEQQEPLFALLDAGRDPDVLTVLYSHDARVRSLYQGPSEASLGPSGPFLVELGPSPELVRALVRRGWSRSWGVFLTCRASFDETRRHFRTLLMVRRHKDQSELYFRFYDPRVLRVFVPTCDREQLGRLFGPVSAFFVEAADGAVLVFTPQCPEGERIDA